METIHAFGLLAGLYAVFAVARLVGYVPRNYREVRGLPANRTRRGARNVEFLSQIAGISRRLKNRVVEKETFYLQRCAGQKHREFSVQRSRDRTRAAITPKRAIVHVRRLKRAVKKTVISKYRS